MKFLITTIVLFVSFVSFSQDQEIKKKEIAFEVNGNCGMCKDRIEKALDIKGVKFAEWNKETHECKVIFDPRKISEEEVHKAIAKVGHDTEKERAPDEAYNSLHGCCLYERK